MKTGTVNLPLHYGRAPGWLFQRMVGLSREITKIIIYEYGTEEFLHRIADPYWFQAFSCVLGFDWHSSGTTTTTCGALKMAIDPVDRGTYDHSIEVLRDAIEGAEIGEEERYRAIRRLGEFV